MLENFKSASTFVDMTFTDKITATFYVIFLGMAITFVVLILIWGIIVLMSKGVLHFEEKRQKKQLNEVNTKDLKVNVSPVDHQIEIVISAAIAAYGNQ